MPNISIITVVKNREDEIARCLRSVDSQLYRDFEHLIIDGKSTDRTLNIINTNKSDKVTLISESDNGLYDAINKGILLAKGNVIGLLHSDDIFTDKNILSDVNDVFKKNPQVDVLYGNLIYFSGKLNKVVRKWDAGEFNPSNIKKGWMIPHPTLFVRSKVYQEIKYDKKYKISSDYDLVLRLLLKNKYEIYYFNKYMVQMSIGGISTSNINNILLKKYEDFIILRNQFNLISCFYILFWKNISKIKQLFVND